MSTAVVLERDDDGGGIALIPRFLVDYVTDGVADVTEWNVGYQGISVCHFGLVLVIVAVPGIDLDAAGAGMKGGLVCRGVTLAIQLVGHEIGVVAGADVVVRQGMSAVEDLGRNMHMGLVEEFSQGQGRLVLMDSSFMFGQDAFLDQKGPQGAADVELVFGYGRLA